jgi:hypothetical protein
MCAVIGRKKRCCTLPLSSADQAWFHRDRSYKMAKRKMLFHPDYVREKIRASQLINRPQKCAFGEISLTVTQLRAIEILLRKSWLAGRSP